MKTVFHIFTILVITAALGLASYSLIQSMPQASITGQTNGERPAFANDQTQANPSQGFKGERNDEFDEPRGFGVTGNLVSVVQHLLLFAAGTILVVVLTKLLTKKRKPIQV